MQTRFNKIDTHADKTVHVKVEVLFNQASSILWQAPLEMRSLEYAHMCVQVLVADMERKLSQAQTAADAARDAAQRETVRAEALAAEKRLLVASEERAAAQVLRRSLTADFDNVVRNVASHEGFSASLALRNGIRWFAVPNWAHDYSCIAGAACGCVWHSSSRKRAIVLRCVLASWDCLSDLANAQVAEISKERFRLAAELEALQGVRACILWLCNLP